jgi:hypothetical protein
LGSFQCTEDAIIAKRDPPDAHAGCVVDRIHGRREHGLQRSFPGSVGRQDHQAAVVSARQRLRPHVTGLAVHLDLGDLRHNGLAAERVRDTAPGQDVSFSRGAWRCDRSTRLIN